MKYVSTRTPGRTFDFSEVLMGSYAPDGGLYVPHKVPHFKKEELSKLEWLPFHELARYVIEPFLGAGSSKVSCPGCLRRPLIVLKATQ